MITPLSVMRRIASPRLAPIGRCCVCGQMVSAHSEFLRIHGGAPVHRECATYKMRNQSTLRLRG